MSQQSHEYDLVICDGRVIDPAQKLDGRFDVAVKGDRIAAIMPKGKAYDATRVVNARGKLVTPGLVDMHVHVFEWATGFGLPPDDAGINAGTTTGIDVGSTAVWTFPGFKHHIIDRAETEIFAFPTLPLAGPLASPLRGGPNIFTAEFIDVGALVALAQRYPDHVRGFKTFAESGVFSQSGASFLEKAVEAGNRAKLPLYIHTGELLQVDESNRPDPASVMPAVLRHARPGDLLGHCYSGMPDGILGDRKKPIPELYEAIKMGIHLDVGHGLNFCFETARRMIDAGFLPYTIGSDVHCSLAGEHDESTLDYSLVGTMSKLLALGVDLNTIIAGTTLHPARVVGKENEIGTLVPGSRADITILEEVEGAWEFHDSKRDKLRTDKRLIPSLVIRAGRAIVPTGRLLRDVLPTAA